MMSILSNKGKDFVIDCAKHANYGESPVTYADVEYDVTGYPKPKEIVLTD